MDALPTSALLGLVVGLILGLTGVGSGVVQAGLWAARLAGMLGGPAPQKGFAAPSALVALGMIARALLA